ncbi:TetR/AcrR family transcriptional regulator [Nocardia sp. bgisy134]|uniref:TetR/AcrR family transcriptional regulator n=1 Tax=Nocardia sp. bgisy134 TaxID=3413789 RepID=UPI003D707D05
MARITPAARVYGGLSASERRTERRSRLREVAIETFGAGVGYRNTRLAELCRAAGLSTRQFYQEYDTLEDLLSELYLHINDMVEQRVLDEVGRTVGQPPTDRATAMVRAYLFSLCTDRRCARIAFVEVVGVGERMDTQRLQCRSRWLDLLCDMFDSFAARGEIAPHDFRLTATTFAGAINGLVHDWAVGWIDATTDQLTESALRMLFGVLGIPHRTEPPAPPLEAEHPPVRRRPRDRRATILRVAARAFAERGYHRTSMADIASAIGITHAALYRHFRTKQDLLGSCLRESLDLIITRVDAARESSGNDSGALQELVRVTLEIRGLARLWQLEFRSLTQADRVGVLSRAVRLTQLIREAIQLRRPTLNTTDREALSWIALSVVTSPSNHHIQLPTEVFATVLDSAIDAITGSTFPGGRSASRLDVTEFDEAGTPPGSEPRPEQMIIAAARLFNERGFGAVSIEDIGASVGVSGPALYHHFAGKTHLLNEIIDRNNEWVEIYAQRALTEGGEPSASLRLVLRYYIQFAIEQTDLVGTAVSEVGHLPDDAAARYRRIHREGNIGWARLLQSLRPELSMPMARVLIHTITTVITDAVRNPRLTRRNDLADLLCVVGERIALAELPTQSQFELCHE